jgi:TetR/AcrR family transcriptional repressor of nem operon
VSFWCVAAHAPSGGGIVTLVSTDRPATLRPARRVRSDPAKTRDEVLDAVERLMLSQGYAAVTYRAVAAEAGVTPALVQYYFRSLDDIFLTAVRRRIEGHVERLLAALEERPDEPLKVIWEFSKNEATAGLMIEFVALGHHRASIRDEIARVTMKVRQVELAAIATVNLPTLDAMGDLTKSSLLILLNGLPKLIRLEASMGVAGAHTDIMAAFERYLDTAGQPARPIRQRDGRRSGARQQKPA